MTEPELDFRALDDLLGQAGEAAYIVDVGAFRDDALCLLGALRSQYQNSSLGYSYKTNYLPLLCREAESIGMYAEVVSGLEYDMACALGIEGKRIIFNGPVKSPLEIEKALGAGSLVNVDNLEELRAIEAVLQRRPDIHARLGLRCSLEMPWRHRSTRFGLSHLNGDLFNAAERIRRLPNATLCGLHSHSFNRAIEAFEERASAMIGLSKEIFPHDAPEFINLGGGLCGPVPKSLSRQLSAKPYTFEEFAASVGSIFATEYGRNGSTELLFEPGVGLVGGCMHYVCRVDSIKRTAGGMTFVTVSGSVNHIKILPNTVNQPIKVYSSGSRTKECCRPPAEIVGFTCLEHDVLYHDFEGDVAPGDVILFSNVGAYSFVTAPEFIRSVPPIYRMVESKTWSKVKAQFGARELLAQFAW